MHIWIICLTVNDKIEFFVCLLKLLIIYRVYILEKNYNFYQSTSISFSRAWCGQYCRMYIREALVQGSNETAKRVSHYKTI